MTDQPDRLAEFRDYRNELYGKNPVGPTDLIDIRVDALDWLIGEAEALRAEVERLRDLLLRLEWDANGYCTICDAPSPAQTGGDGHRPDCELAAELRST